MDKKQFYHLFANGEDSRNFIVCETDRFAAFNRVGICSFSSGVKVASFSIEDSHIHSLLYGTYEECVTFKEKYELSTLHYIVNSRGSKDDVDFHCELIPVEDENYLLDVAVYTIIQPTKDGKGVLPFDYLWGSGSLYFRQEKTVPVWNVDSDGVVHDPCRLDSLPLRRRQALLHSKYDIPGNWLICNGFLLPTNYIDVSLFENIYGTYNRYRVFLGNSRKKDEIISLTMASARGVEVEDIEARRLCSEACHMMFGHYDPRPLSPLNRLKLAMDIRNRHGLSMRQISTVTRLPEREVRRYLGYGIGGSK